MRCSLLRHTFACSFHRVQEFFPDFLIASEGESGIDAVLLFLISVADPVIGSFLIKPQSCTRIESHR